MNKRFEELWEQSRIGTSMGFDTEKFATLIVKECAEVALREDHEPSECILNHFGIED